MGTAVGGGVAGDEGVGVGAGGEAGVGGRAVGGPGVEDGTVADDTGVVGARVANSPVSSITAARSPSPMVGSAYDPLVFPAMMILPSELTDIPYMASLENGSGPIEPSCDIRTPGEAIRRRHEFNMSTVALIVPSTCLCKR